MFTPDICLGRVFVVIDKECVRLTFTQHSWRATKCNAERVFRLYHGDGFSSSQMRLKRRAWKVLPEHNTKVTNKAAFWCFVCALRSAAQRSAVHLLILIVIFLTVISFFFFLLLPPAPSAQIYQTGSWLLTRRKPSASQRWGSRCWENTPSLKSLLRNRMSLRWEWLLFQLI